MTTSPARRLPPALLLLALCATAAAAQPAGEGAPRADTLLRAEALREDARVLRSALEELHPGLLRYNTPAQVERAFARLERTFSRDRSLPEAYLAIAGLLGGLRCGHTFPNPANQPRAVAEAVFRGTPRVPFYFRWLDGRMVVTRDASASGAFPPGTEVLAVNGVPARRILERLLPFSRTDGGNEAKRLASLELLPAARWQAFDVYFPHLFPPPPGAWRFRVRAPGGAVRTVDAPPVDAAQRTALYDSLLAARRDTASPPWTLRFPDARMAVLEMPTWVTYNDRWDWEGFLRRAFGELAARGTPALVIDLRGNEGGSAVGNVLLSHLVDAPVTLDRFRRFTRYRRLPEALRPHLDTWDRSFDDWGEAATPSAERPGFFRLVRAGEDTAGTVIRPAAPRYAGRVFVLVGAANSSATFEFALAARERGLATLVGQPTGGNRRGINGGAFYFLRLPRSRIEVDLPLVAQFPTSPQPDAGIAPDVEVRVTAADLAAGRDPELEAVRRSLAAGGAR